MRMDRKKEAERVRIQLQAYERYMHQGTSSFWVEPDKARVLVTLKDWVAQVPRFAKFCGNFFRRVCETLFPLDPFPPGLRALLRDFQYREQI